MRQSTHNLNHHTLGSGCNKSSTGNLPCWVACRLAIHLSDTDEHITAAGGKSALCSGNGVSTSTHC